MTQPSAPPTSALRSSWTTREASPGALALLGTVVALAAVYFAAGKLGLKLAFAHPSATPVWPPTGIALAAFLLLGARVWPGILTGAFLVNLTTAGTALTSLGIATGNTLEGLVGAWLAHRFAGGRRPFEGAADVFRFAALAGLAAATVSATSGVTSLALGGFAPWGGYGSIWLTWWLGDVGGALVVAPLLLLWAGKPRPRWDRPRALEAALLLASLVLVGLVNFAGPLPSGMKSYPLLFLSLPLLVWAAFRFTQREAATATALLSGIAIWGTLRGFGPFVRDTPNESLLLLQAFMGVIGVTTLAVAASVAEGRRTEAALSRTAAIVDSSEDAIIGETLGGTIESWNAGARRLYGYAGDEVKGWPVSILVPPELADETAEILDKVRRGDSVDTYETVRLRRDGRRIVVSLKVSPIRDASGRIVGASAIARDITEKKRAERRQAAQFAVTRILTESATLREAAPRLLNTLCQGLEWDVGEVWRAEAEADALRREARWPEARGWSAPGGDGLLARGQDLPGLVWESGRHLWVEDVAAEGSPVRTRAAAAGLHAALAWPLRIGHDVEGVLALYSREAREPSRPLIDILDDIGGRVGQFLERERAFEGLRSSEERYRLLFERNLAGVYRATLGGRLLECNEAFARILGYSSREEALARTAWDLFFTRTDREVSTARLKEKGTLTNFELRMRRKDGAGIWVLENETLLTGHDGEDLVEGTLIDITERKLAEERIEFHAYHDPLTGLPNRTFLMDRARVALAQARRSGRRLAVVLLDLDRFKEVNDSLGHGGGDRLLQEVAGRLRACVREDDTVARLGGDEFVLLLPNIRRAGEAARIARTILARVGEPFRLEGRELRTSASAGIAVFPEDGEEAETLLRNADGAMYRVKDLGRNGYEFHQGPRPGAASRARMDGVRARDRTDGGPGGGRPPSRRS